MPIQYYLANDNDSNDQLADNSEEKNLAKCFSWQTLAQTRNQQLPLHARLTDAPLLTVAPLAAVFVPT